MSGNDYLRGFASDRSHMRLSDGAWQAVPPTYPCITASGRFNRLWALCQHSWLLSHANRKLTISCTADGATMRLQDYISMTATANHHDPSAASLLGTVYTEKAFLEKFLLQSASPSTQVQQQSLATSL